MDEFHDGQYPPSPGEEGVILISDSEIEDSPEIREVGTLTRTKPFAGVPFGGKPPFEGKPFGGKPFEFVDVEDIDDEVVYVEDTDDEIEVLPDVLNIVQIQPGTSSEQPRICFERNVPKDERKKKLFANRKPVNIGK